VNPANDASPEVASRLVTSRRIEALEGLRAGSAIAIFVFHAASFTGATSVPGGIGDGAGPWIQALSVAVAVFFVLSGFLLYRPFVAADLGGEPAPRLAPYLVRRLARIYPAYWVALAGSAVLLDLSLGDAWSTFRFFALIQIYWSDTVLGGLPHAWTLNTEVAFYLFLPLWAALVRRWAGPGGGRVSTHLVGLGGLYLLGIGFRWWLRASGASLGYGTLLANIDLFAIGMALAVVGAACDLGERPLPALLEVLRHQVGLAWLAALCCLASVVAMEWPTGFTAPTATQEVARQVLFGAIAGLLVAPAAFGDRSRLLTGLRWPPLVFVGMVSYGVYLWHMTVLDLLVRQQIPTSPGTLQLLAVAVPITCVLATASWYGVEGPVLRRAHRWSTPRRAALDGRSSSVQR
jgi:peptidoglycan/LPS O-acetylase OafA/YrhL